MLRFPYPIRRAAGRLIRPIPRRIRSGPIAGLRWSMASSGRGYLSGTFDRGRVRILQTMLRRGDCVWDVGAHKGYMTLVAARMVGTNGRVYAFEPSLDNLWFVRRHAEWSGFSNIEVIHAALSDFDGSEYFGGRGSTTAFRLRQGKEIVDVRRGDSLIGEGEALRPDFVKVDAEGEDASLVEGVAGELGDDAILLISIHNWDNYVAVKGLLEGRDFRVVESATMRRRAARAAIDPSRWARDPDLVAIGPGRSLDQEGERALRAFQTEA